mgnify:FL=1
MYLFKFNTQLAFVYGGDIREVKSENIVENVEEEIMLEPLENAEEKKKPDIHFFGRRKLLSSYTKSEINEKILAEILPQVLREHEANANEIDYLYRYYKGEQPILEKEKVVRPEINNITLENHAFEIVEFKKSYVYGEPIQYVQKGEKDGKKINPEISLLNKFMESEDKSSLDKELAEWQYIAGTAYRWTETDEKDEEDEAPFELSVPDPRRTFVVYHNGIKEYPLFSGYISYFSKNIMTNERIPTVVNYRVVTIYTDDAKYMFSEEEKKDEFKIMPQAIPISEDMVTKYPLVVKGQRIIEYPLNNARLGLIELVMSDLEAINKIKSADLDGIDQFIQSLLVFVNQEVDIQTFRKLVAEGAIQVTSSDPNKPADVKLLTNQLTHTETKVVSDDRYESLLSIVGIPRLNHKASGGDTGQARLLGEGWTMADERAKQDELSFKKSERKMLKLVIDICKYKNKLTDLKLSDIDIKFTRNKSDNLLVKTQGLMNMQTAQVPPEVAFVTCGLFSDPNDVYQKGKEYYGEDFWKQNSNQNKNTLASEGITDRTNTSTHSETNGEGVEKGNKDGRGISKNIS